MTAAQEVRALKNAKRDLKRFTVAARQTVGAERAKYLQGCDNLKRYISVLERKVQVGYSL